MKKTLITSKLNFVTEDHVNVDIRQISCLDLVSNTSIPFGAIPKHILGTSSSFVLQTLYKCKLYGYSSFDNCTQYFI